MHVAALAARCAGNRIWARRRRSRRVSRIARVLGGATGDGNTRSTARAGRRARQGAPGGRTQGVGSRRYLMPPRREKPDAARAPKPTNRRRSRSSTSAASRRSPTRMSSRRRPPWTSPNPAKSGQIQPNLAKSNQISPNISLAVLRYFNRLNVPASPIFARFQIFRPTIRDRARPTTEARNISITVSDKGKSISPIALAFPAATIAGERRGPRRGGRRSRAAFRATSRALAGLGLSWRRGNPTPSRAGRE